MVADDADAGQLRPPGVLRRLRRHLIAVPSRLSPRCRTEPGETSDAPASINLAADQIFLARQNVTLLLLAAAITVTFETPPSGVRCAAGILLASLAILNAGRAVFHNR